MVLAFFAVVQILLSLAARFSQPILMFLLGAVLAYLLIPTVNLVQRLVRKRWAAILLVYLLVFAAVLGLGTVLFSPFVSQARSFAANLNKPSSANLQALVAVKSAAARVDADLAFQQGLVDSGLAASPSQMQTLRTEITALQSNIESLQQSSALQPSNGARQIRGINQAPPPRTRIPPSYVAPLRLDAARLDAAFTAASSSSGAAARAALARAVAAAASVRDGANSAYASVSSTALLLLDLQAWLDDHSIKADIHQGFGQVTRQLSTQTALIVNNSIGVVLAAGTLFINGILVLIISIYFLSDGPRLVNVMKNMGPPVYRDHIPFYLASLDRSLSGYIRGQIALAAAAGILGAGGALVLDVPYAVLIGLSTFFLSLVPVIGPIVLIFPPVVIALVFAPLNTAIILSIYFLVMMQLITNVVGPRVMGSAVGIHPLEAMAAAFIGFPIAGVLGSFFAVPIVGFLHVAIRHAYTEFVLNPVPHAPTPRSTDPGEASSTVESSLVERTHPA